MRRYSISIHKDKNLVELARRYLEKRFQNSQGLTEISTSNLVNPTSINWNSAIYLTTEGKKGLAFPANDNIDQKASTIPQKHFLILVDFRDQFQTETIFLWPDDYNALGSFTGVIMPYNQNAHTFSNLIAPASKRLQYAGFVPHLPASDSTKDPAEPADERLEKSFTLVNNHVTIGDIVDYLKCFDNNPSNDHTYQVMLCVSQPIPGSRDPWGLSKRNHEETGNPVCVGHTFLVLTEKSPNKVITRNLGFYPNGFVWPYKPMEQGELVNDSYHDYNICLLITVKSHEFFAILKFVKQGNDRGFMYNLNSNNCTTFALNALGIANIQIPRTIGYWKGGSGCNPGDLGEDLRLFTLSSNMQRITVYQAHGNKGNCII